MLEIHWQNGTTCQFFQVSADKKLHNKDTELCKSSLPKFLTKNSCDHYGAAGLISKCQIIIAAGKESSEDKRLAWCSDLDEDITAGYMFPMPSTKNKYKVQIPPVKMVDENIPHSRITASHLPQYTRYLCQMW